MSASFCGTNTQAIDSNTTSTFSHTLSAGSNRLVVVVISYIALFDMDVTGIIYGGVSMHVITDAYAKWGSAGSRVNAYYLEEADLPSNGLKTIDPAWNSSSASMRMAVYCYCLQDCPSPVISASASANQGNTFYPVGVSLTGGGANSVILSSSTHNDKSTGALSASTGVQSTEMNEAGQIRSRGAYDLDVPTSSFTETWDVASDSGTTKGSAILIGIDYTAASSNSPGGWGVLL